GQYTLLLNADDGATTKEDSVIVSVLPPSTFRTFKGVDVYTTAIGGMRGTYRYPSGEELLEAFHPRAGTGEFVISGVEGTIKKAYLYWNGPVDPGNPHANAEVIVAGRWIVGTNIGIAGAHDWTFNQGGHPYDNNHTYRADITTLIATYGNGHYSVSNFVKCKEV